VRKNSTNSLFYSFKEKSTKGKGSYGRNLLKGMILVFKTKEF